MVPYQGRPGFFCLTLTSANHTRLQIHRQNSLWFCFLISAHGFLLSLHPDSVLSIIVKTKKAKQKTKKLAFKGPWLYFRTFVPFLFSVDWNSMFLEPIPSSSCWLPSVPVSAQCVTLDFFPLCTHTRSFAVFCLFCCFLFYFCILKSSSPVTSLDLFLFFLRSKAQCLSIYPCLPITNK